MKRWNHWTAADTATLRRLYKHRTAEALAALLGRTRAAIYLKRRELGLTKRDAKVGEERFYKGYLHRKTSGRRKGPVWVPVHVLKWEKRHGKVPKGKLLWFKNGDRRDARLCNLELITRADIMRRNHINNIYPKELRSVMSLNTYIRKEIERRAA